MAGTNAYGLDRSTDGGMHWTAIDSGIPNGVSFRVIQCLAASGLYLFAGTQAGIFCSSMPLDDGAKSPQQRKYTLWPRDCQPEAQPSVLLPSPSLA